MTVRFEMRLSDELMAEVDRRRGLASRAAWIRDQVERACSGINMTVRVPPPVDAVARAADQAERTIPVSPPPERWEAGGEESGVKPSPSPGELKTRAAMMERQRKLNEKRGS